MAPRPISTLSFLELESTSRSVPDIIHVAFPLSSAKMIFSDTPKVPRSRMRVDFDPVSSSLPDLFMTDTRTLYPRDISFPFPSVLLAACSTSPSVRLLTVSEYIPSNTLFPSLIFSDVRVSFVPAMITNLPLFAPVPMRTVSTLSLERTSRFVPCIIHIDFSFLSVNTVLSDMPKAESSPINASLAVDDTGSPSASLRDTATLYPPSMALCLESAAACFASVSVRRSTVSFAEPLTTLLSPGLRLRELLVFSVPAMTMYSPLFSPIPIITASSPSPDSTLRSAPSIIHVAFPLLSSNMVLSDMPTPASRPRNVDFA